MTTEAPRRFYKEAALVEDASAFGVALDGRAVKTPKGMQLSVPTRALGKAIAAEWEAQGERIVYASMPLTQFAFASIDRTDEERADVVAEIGRYGGTDLVCHRADTPAALAKRQAAAWDPLVEWARDELQAELPVVAGVIAADVPLETIVALRARASGLDDFLMTALIRATHLAGSAIIGFGLTLGRLDGEHAYAAAAVDEEWNLDTWGEDALARVRLDRARAEFAALAHFVALLS